jgi:hypothetical protein
VLDDDGSGLRAGPDGDGVESVIIACTAEFEDPRPGRSEQVAAFGAIDGEERVTEIGRAAGLHFDEGHGAAPARHDVEFAMPDSPVSIQDLPSAAHQSGGGERLSLRPKSWDSAMGKK